MGFSAPVALTLSGQRAESREDMWDSGKNGSFGVRQRLNYPCHHLIAWKPWTNYIYFPWSLNFLIWKRAHQALLWSWNALCAGVLAQRQSVAGGQHVVPFSGLPNSKASSLLDCCHALHRKSKDLESHVFEPVLFLPCAMSDFEKVTLFPGALVLWTTTWEL